MKLTPPTKFIFLLSAVLAALAIFGRYTEIPYVSGNAFWVLAVGYFVLVIGNVFKRL